MHASGHIRSRAFSPWLRLALLALLLIAFGIRLQALTRQDIWWDEARNIDVALRPFTQIAVAPELDIQPPVYYWLLHVWNGLLGVQLGQAPAQIAFFSRLLSVFAGVAGVALLFPLARRAAGPALGQTAGVLAVVVGACAAFWLGESQEARMYTLGFALLAAAALVLLHYVGGQAAPAGCAAPETTRRSPWGTLAAFVLLSTAALLTHYNVVFVLVAWYVWWGGWALLRQDRLRQLGVVFGCGLAMVLLVLPMAPIALRQIPDYANPNITVVSVGEYLFQNWQAYAGGYAFDPALLGGNGLTWLWAVLAVAGLGLVAALLPRRGTAADSLAATNDTGRESGIDWPALLLLGAWLVGSLALYYVAVLDRNAFNVRYASFITPALYALLGIGFAGYARWSRWLPGVAAAVLLLGAVPALQADLYDSRFDREHIGEVTAWLRANAQPGDVILVDQKYPFGFYYQPYTIDQSVAETSGGTSGGTSGANGTAPARYLFVDINTLDQELDKVAGDARRVFWVQWFESDTDPRKAVPFLLDKYGVQAGEQWFQGYALDWWDLQPPTAFALAPDLEPVQIAFPPAVQTVALSLPHEPLSPGAPLPVVIRWQRTPGGEVSRPLKARVALYDANDNRLVQADERLLNDRHRAPSQWGPDDQPLNVYMLPLPADLSAGSYSVRVLVYDADTLEPLTLVDAAGNPAGQEAELGKITVGNPQ